MDVSGLIHFSSSLCRRQLEPMYVRAGDYSIHTFTQRFGCMSVSQLVCICLHPSHPHIITPERSCMSFMRSSLTSIILLLVIYATISIPIPS